MTTEEAPRLTTRQITGDAVALLRQSFDVAWPWWFFLFVLESGNAARAVLMSPPPPAAGHLPPPLTPLAIGLTLGLGAVATLLGAFALRAMISGKAERPRLDGGLWGYVGLSFAGQAAWTLITVVTSPLAERAIALAPGARPPPELLPEMIGALVGFGVLAFLFARLALWPAARLMGETAIGPAASWRRMRGAVWPLVASTLLLVLPVAMAGVAVLITVQGPTLPLASSPVLGVMAALESALELAVMAAIWRARVKPAPVVLSKPAA